MKKFKQTNDHNKYGQLMLFSFLNTKKYEYKNSFYKFSIYIYFYAPFYILTLFILFYFTHINP